ncbi:uncharacterized protein G2W53_014235 [Senna tora]|uniref:Uncharacterized protein n=1 Tax=Senna tora TaxID=362788 RepID=A0A835C7M7_9FABA|nr:uncharacterized protein G2W53_014235 [Senna tora]
MVRDEGVLEGSKTSLCIGQVDVRSNTPKVGKLLNDDGHLKDRRKTRRYDADQVAQVPDAERAKSWYTRRSRERDTSFLPHAQCDVGCNFTSAGVEIIMARTLVQVGDGPRAWIEVKGGVPSDRLTSVNILGLSFEFEDQNRARVAFQPLLDLSWVFRTSPSYVPVEDDFPCVVEARKSLLILRIILGCLSCAASDRGEFYISFEVAFNRWGWFHDVYLYHGDDRSEASSNILRDGSFELFEHLPNPSYREHMGCAM